MATFVQMIARLDEVLISSNGHQTSVSPNTCWDPFVFSKRVLRHLIEPFYLQHSGALTGSFM